MSPLEEFTHGGFRNVIGDPEVAGAKRLVLSSGKLHWEMYDTRREKSAEYGGTALARLEQLYPFPRRELVVELQRHPNAEVVWAQEEPENQGAWLMIRENLEQAIAEADAGHTLTYVGRPHMASTATGYAHIHAKTQAELIAQALGKPLEQHDVEEQLEKAEVAKTQD